MIDEPNSAPLRREADGISDSVIAILREVVPNLRPETLIHDESLCEQTELNQMTWRRFLKRIVRAFDLEMPQSDYSNLHTVDDVADLIRRRLQVRTMYYSRSEHPIPHEAGRWTTGSIDIGPAPNGPRAMIRPIARRR